MTYATILVVCAHCWIDYVQWDYNAVDTAFAGLFWAIPPQVLESNVHARFAVITTLTEGETERQRERDGGGI